MRRLRMRPVPIVLAGVMLRLLAFIPIPLTVAPTMMGLTLAAYDDDQSPLIRNFFELRLKDKRITVAVSRLPGGKYGIRLSGDVISEAEKGKIKESALEIRKDDKVNDLVDERDIDDSGIGIAVVETETQRLIGRIKSLADSHLAGSNAIVRVVPKSNLSFDLHVLFPQARLRWKYEPEELRSFLHQELSQLTSGYSIDSVTFATAPPPPSDPVATGFWQLVALDTAEALGVKEAFAPATALVTTLNSLYGTEKEPVVRQENGNLWIKTNQSNLQKIKGWLALVDVPFPQVQMETWAIQASGQRHQVARQMALVQDDIEFTQSRVAAAHRAMRDALNAHVDLLREDDSLKDIISELSVDAMWFAPFIRQATINECLILLALAPLQGCCNDCNVTQSLEDTSHPFAHFLRNLEIERCIALGNVQAQICGIRSSRAPGFLDQELEIQLASLQLRELSLRDEEAMKRSWFRKLKRIVEDESGRAALKLYLSAFKDFRDYLRACGLFGKPQGRRAPDCGDCGGVCGSGGVSIQSIGQLTTPKATKDETASETLEKLKFAPENMSHANVAVDGLIQQLAEAFQSDVQQLYLDPLLRRIQSGEGMSIGGIGLAGKTRIVVTSRRQASLRAQMSSYVETTRPAPFGNEILNALFPKGAGGQKTTTTVTSTPIARSDKTESSSKQLTITNTPPDATRDKSESESRSERSTTDNATEKRTEESTVTTDSTGLEGLAKLLAGLPQGKAALIAGALLNEVAPTFAKVAPGISIAVTPSVAASGTRADLKINCTFGVPTESFGFPKDRTDVWAQAPPSAVNSHEIDTHTAVEGFKLFGISSFNIATSSPQAPAYVPVLGRLPVFGPLFQIPRGSKRVEHQSIILVNATIVPRSMGLASYYSATRPLALLK